MNPKALAKRRLFKQVWACAKAGTAGTESHLAAVKSFHAAAWECFAERNVDPPQRRIEYIFVTRQDGDTRQIRQQSGQPAPIDPRTKKAILSLERDCEFCCQELHRAMDAWADGTRPKIRSIEALSKWRKDYEKRWAMWLSRSTKKLPANLQRMTEFAEKHGRVVMIAGDAEGKLFASAKDAQRYLQRSTKTAEQNEATRWFHDETNQKLMALFDKASAENDPALWQQLEQALKAVEDEDKAAEVSSDASYDE